MARFRLGLALLVALSIGWAASVRAATIVLSDGDFDDGDWVVEDFGFHTGGSTTAGRVAAGGDPGAYRQVVHSTNAAIDPTDNASIYTFHGYTPTVVDPGVVGAITSVDFYWDVRSFPDVVGNGQLSGPALKQGDAFYVSAGLGEVLGAGQEWRPVQRLGVLGVNFGRIQDVFEIDPAQDPDFSASGAPITFGFFSSLSGAIGGTGITSTGGYDDWRVEVRTVPGPGAAAQILVAGLLGASGGRAGRWAVRARDARGRG